MAVTVAWTSKKPTTQVDLTRQIQSALQRHEWVCQFASCLFLGAWGELWVLPKFAVEVGQQVDAMNRLCDPIQDRWHKLLLNQHAGARRIVDPFSGLDFDSEEVETDQHCAQYS